MRTAAQDSDDPAPRQEVRGANSNTRRRGAPGLQSRLLLVTLPVLAVGLGAVGWWLDRSHKEAVRAAAQEHLGAAAFGILSIFDERDGAIVLAATPAEPRLSNPDGGLYAFVEVAGEGVIWASPSAIARGIDLAKATPPKRPAPGEPPKLVPANAHRFALGYTVIWETLNVQATIWVLVERTQYDRQVDTFRRDAALGLLGATLAFVVIQFAAVRWGLTPVRRMVARIRALEAGSRTDVGHDYPAELARLASTLNRFVVFERDHRERYRRAMDDLAHSLKTPLAVLRNAARGWPGETAGVATEQLARMENTVARQLARAVAARPTLPAGNLAVLPLAARITRALQRAYTEKGVTVDAPWERGEDAVGDCVVRVDEDDAMDMLGNLIENAFKYTRSRVRFSAHGTTDRVRITIEDDGDGVPAPARQLVLRRGVRADDATAGQGIGLAVVAELAAAYDGAVEIGDSEWGGAALRLELPGGRTRLAGGV